jgi:YD repeat-containing protein
MRHRLVSYFLFMIFAASAIVRAENSPFTARGFAADKAYETHDLDAINVFNGNVNVTIPIGKRYAVGETLSYQFVLSYGGNVWDHDSRQIITQEPNTGKTLSHRVEYAYVGHARITNAGLGWRLSLGSLSMQHPSDPEYVSPDGAQHRFYPKLHDETTSVSGAAYTRDGTYLRRTASGTGWNVEFPDGTIHTFDSRGMITSMKDRFGHVVTIRYQAGPDGALDWTVDDKIRTHRVDMIRLTRAANAPDFGTFDVVKTITLADTSATPSNEAVQPSIYQLQYVGGDGFAPLSRKLAMRQDCEVSPVAFAPLLESVTLPDGSTYGVAPDRGDVALTTVNGIPTYTGTYASPEGQFDGVHFRPGVTCTSTPGLHTSASGQLTKLTRPTLGTVEWTYQTYQFPVEVILIAGSTDPCDGRACRFSLSARKSWGVKERIERNRSGQAVSRRLYTHEVITAGGAANWKTSKTSVARYAIAGSAFNLLSTDVNYYMVPNYGGGELFDYGIPYTRDPQLAPPGDTISEAGPYLSTELRDASGRLVRYRYLKYDWDLPFYSGEESQNRRVVLERVVDLNPNGTIADDVTTKFDDFDSFGNFRTTTVSPTGSTTESRKTTTHSNARFETSTGTFRLPNISEPWVLSTHDFTSVEDQDGSGAVSAARTDYCFAANGFMEWKRVWRGGAASKTDFVTVFRDVSGTGAADGNVSREEYYGGDVTPLTSETIACPLGTGAPGPLGYAINHEYANGVLKSSQYQGAPFKSVNLTINANGLPFESRDSANVLTSLSYDTSGRVTTLTPFGRAPTTYTYTNASGSAPASVSVKHVCSTCGTSGPGETRHYYDDFGRLAETRQEVTLPDGSTAWSAVWFTYDSLGRKATASVAKQESSGASGARPSTINATKWAYDVLGRVESITQPDGSITNFNYTGSRITNRESRIETAAGSSTILTRETNDFLGRLKEVIDDVGQTNLITTYSYDAGDRLRSVNGPRLSSEASRALRTFQYDDAGSLTSETHPESGTTTYSKFDARGHALEKRAQNCWFDQKYTFDTAERLIKVDVHRLRLSTTTCLEDAWRTSKEFIYATSTTTGTLSKLQTAIRWNVRDEGVFKVTETYAYDAFGRTQVKTTEIDEESQGDHVQTFTQRFAYDVFDRPSGLVYPVCEFNCGSAPYDGAVMTYDRGNLKAVQAALEVEGTLEGAQNLANLSYHPSGLRAKVAHANGVTDTVEQDASGMARPRSFTFSGYSNDCVAPHLSLTPVAPRVGVGSTVTFTATVTGTGPIKYEWVRGSPGPDQIVIAGATSSRYTTEVLTQDSTFSLIVSSPCGAASATRHVRVLLPAPSSVLASRSGSTNVSVTWSAVSGAAEYSVTRRTRSGVTTLPLTTATSLIDAGCPLDAACVYTVRAIAGDERSDPSTADLVTMRSFTALNSSKFIENEHFDEILFAINAIREAAALDALTWSEILLPSVPAPANGRVVADEHVLALRTALADARAAHGISNPDYVDQLGTGMPIKASHLTELQGRTQ